MGRSSDQSKSLQARDNSKIILTTETHRATLSKGRIELERLVEKEKLSGSDRKTWTAYSFPEKSYTVADITCMGLTPEFLVYGNRARSIFYFSLQEQSPLPVTEHCHVDCGILRLWLNPCGSRLVFEDEHHSIYLFNPFNDQVLPVTGFKGALEAVLWDVNDSQIFILAESNQNFVYLYSHTNIWCPSVTFLGASARPFGFQATGLHNGILHCKVENGETKNLILPTHQWKHKGAQGTEQLIERFKESLTILNFKEAWNDALLLKSTEIWDKFTQKALEHLEVEIAIKSCQQSKNVKMLPYLQHIEQVENRALLAGHIFVLFGDHDAAQDAFLKSCCLEAALEMRRNLQQWEQALPLAVELGGSCELEVRMEYATLLERRGEHRSALGQYESLLSAGVKGKQLSSAKAGVARTSIHCGDPWKGRQMAIQCDDASLYIECAVIFESMKLLEDAGDFFELGGQLEKAFSCYICMRNLTKAKSLLNRICSPKHFCEYAKVMEEAGDFAEAMSAYDFAEDHTNVIRLLLGPLQNPSKAYAIVRKTKAIPGAVLAAKFCKSAGDYGKAIEFLLLSRRSQEAKELAEQHDCMDVYTELVVDVTSEDECLELSRYYETMGDYCKAGTLLEHCGQTERALKLYLCWGSNGGVEQAINLVGREKSDMFTSQLLDYLKKANECGEDNAIHFYMLHKTLGNYDEAAKLVLQLSSHEQEKGNYKRAHQLLLDFSLVLRNYGRAIPADILQSLMLLHSYVLGKIHIRLGDHSTGSRLLIRVARSITKFPAHIVPILTSTVIECHRTGLLSTAFEFASMLMCPEYRNSISSAYKRKVEKIVRKCEKVEEKEPLTPCPVCAALLPNMQLHCGNCNSDIPFCIASGRHMVLEDWSACPQCKFPALATEFLKVLESESACPMCSQKVSAADIVCEDDPLGQRDSYAATT
ncbi:hypothetical protein GOP47_0002717 [Adiantum capillus-veneris]|uniref:WD repeat-containing protein 19 n=1 Tax=Adiantum capillus-veneris TaxID=13818 RepID=A0A9D4ZPF3_ADICA|nr:hypothetical protein GOP47_0002717 [Adiantum capillus-veneris]